MTTLLDDLTMPLDELISLLIRAKDACPQDSKNPPVIILIDEQHQRPIVNVSAAHTEQGVVVMLSNIRLYEDPAIDSQDNHTQKIGIN